MSLQYYPYPSHGSKHKFLHSSRLQDLGPGPTTWPWLASLSWAHLESCYPMISYVHIWYHSLLWYHITNFDIMWYIIYMVLYTVSYVYDMMCWNYDIIWCETQNRTGHPGYQAMQLRLTSHQWGIRFVLAFKSPSYVRQPRDQNS